MTMLAAHDRRQFVGRACVLLGVVAAGSAAAGAPPGLVEDDGSPIRTLAGPDHRRLLALPGLLTAGAGDGGVIVAEFFDYNCGYCREAAPGLDRMLKDDGSLRLALVQTPILSPGSLRAAEAVAAVHALEGAAAAYEIHKRVLAAPGRISDAQVIEAARASGLDAPRIESAMASPAVQDVVRAQKQFAAESRLRYTPTFAIGDVGFIGWPGVATMTRFVAAARRCGSPQCDPAPAGGR